MLTFPEYESFDGLGLAQLVQRKIMTPLELIEAAIQRIELRNPKLNAVIYKMYDAARLAAKEVDITKPFAGVPFLLKDLLAACIGAPLGLGSRFTHDWFPGSDT